VFFGFAVLKGTCFAAKMLYSTSISPMRPPTDSKPGSNGSNAPSWINPWLQLGLGFWMVNQMAKLPSKSMMIDGKSISCPFGKHRFGPGTG